MNDHHKGRFISYATGEILLVVIGILIALQINNWNEERIEQQQIREYALNLASDIEQDMVMIATVEFQIRRLMLQAETFADYAQGREYEDFDNAEVYFLTAFNDYLPFTWNRAAMEQLKTSGGLRQMRNQRLVSRISAYDALTHHLDQDYKKDVDLANAMQAHIDRVRDANYGEDTTLLQWYESMDEDDYKSRYLNFRDSQAFALLKAKKLPLLTDGVRDLRLLANYQLQVARLAAPRVGHELPELRKIADEILELIDQEYH